MEQEIQNDGPSASAAMSLMTGTRLHEFELLSVIGEGGFSIVYLAYDHSLQRTVAIKEYLPGAIAFRDAQGLIRPRYEKYESTFNTGLKSFLNEARILAQFEHPALIRIHRFWEQNGTAYMVMQYCAGKTLRKLLLVEPERQSDEHWLKAQIMEPVLDALQLLHSKNYYHRDLSPDNIIVMDSGMPMLLDFGAARQVIGDMTQALTVILKPGFAPIEQYADDESMRQGPWTDIYGVGAVMYFAVTGKAPVASVARLVKDPLKKLSHAEPRSISTAFAQTIDHALAVFPNDRPQSIEELRQALLQHGGSNSAAAATVLPEPSIDALRRTVATTGVEPVVSAPTVVAAPALATRPQTDPLQAAETPANPAQSHKSATPATPDTTFRPAEKAQRPSADARHRHSPFRWSLAAGVMAMLLVLGVMLSWWIDREPLAPQQIAEKEAVSVDTSESLASTDSALHAITEHQDGAADARLWEATAAREFANEPLDSATITTGIPAASASDVKLNIAELSPAQIPGTAQEPRNSQQVISSPPPLTPVAVAKITPSAVAPSAQDGHATADAKPGAYLRFAIQPWGRVVIDGQEKGISPPMTRIWLPEGRHQVVIVNGDLQKFTESIQITNKKDVVLTHKF